MKKAMFASVLAAAAVSAPYCLAQDAGAQPAGAQPASGQVQLQPDEFAAYQNVTTAADPAAKATAAEAFLTKYPQSSVKTDVLTNLALAYYQQNNLPKLVDASDRLLQADPNNIRGLVFETTALKQQGDATADAAGRQTLYDKAASFAQRGLTAPKPATVDQAQWDTFTKSIYPTFYSTIGADDLGKKDYPGAITAYTTELKGAADDATKQPGPLLQDTFYLGQAYYQSTPPDYLNCAFFTQRAATYAPDQFKSQFQPTADYCYKKYHGGADGQDAVKTAAAASIFPTDSFKTSVKAAPTPADQATALLASDKADDATLAKTNIQDREFVIQYGTSDQADAEFTPIKGKEVEISGAVVSISGTDLQLAVSDDAKTANPQVADFDITLKEEPKTPPTVGATVKVVGIVDSYTQKPVMVKMTGGDIQAKKATAAPARKAPVRRR